MIGLKKCICARGRVSSRRAIGAVGLSVLDDYGTKGAQYSG